jgi:hypothetical protein
MWCSALVLHVLHQVADNQALLLTLVAAGHVQNNARSKTYVECTRLYCSLKSSQPGKRAGSGTGKETGRHKPEQAEVATGALCGANYSLGTSCGAAAL